MKKYIFIGLGGFAGAMARFAAKSAPLWPGEASSPNTLIINVLGSFLLAFLLTAVINSLDRDLKTGISTGLLGAFTTFSTLCREAFVLIQSGHWLIAAAYTAVSAALGLTAAYLGIKLARKIGRKRYKEYAVCATGAQEEAE